jgi:hypothetical protein
MLQLLKTLIMTRTDFTTRALESWIRIALQACKYEYVSLSVCRPVQVEAFLFYHRIIYYGIRKILGYKYTGLVVSGHFKCLF